MLEHVLRESVVAQHSILRLADTIQRRVACMDLLKAKIKNVVHPSRRVRELIDGRRQDRGTAIASSGPITNRSSHVLRVRNRIALLVRLA
jgi:hypothetical protein